MRATLTKQRQLSLVSKLGELRNNRSELVLGSGGGLGLEGGGLLLLGVVSSRANLALVLESLDESVVLPAVVVGEISETAEVATRLETEVADGLRDNHALDAIVRVGDSLEGLQAVESVGTTLGLVRDHTTDSAPEDSGGSTVVDNSVAGVDVTTLLEEISELDCEGEKER